MVFQAARFSMSLDELVTGLPRPDCIGAGNNSVGNGFKREISPTLVEAPILLAIPQYQSIEEADVMGYFSILGAIPGFFLSSFIFMLLWGVIAPKIGLGKIDYPLAMLITITLWLAVAPLAAVRKSK